MSRAALFLVSLCACAPSIRVTRVTPAPLSTRSTIAIAASGPYATDLVAGVRAKLKGRATVEACVLGCPAVGLYASLSLTPGPHEGRVLRTCQAEVYTGESWATPNAMLVRVIRSVDELDDCVRLVATALLEPKRSTLRLRLDDRGPLGPAVHAVSTGDLTHARALLEALPKSAGSQYDLALLHEAEGRLDDAKRCANEAKQLGAEGWMVTALDEQD